MCTRVKYVFRVLKFPYLHILPAKKILGGIFLMEKKNYFSLFHFFIDGKTVVNSSLKKGHFFGMVFCLYLRKYS